MTNTTDRVYNSSITFCSPLWGVAYNGSRTEGRKVCVCNIPSTPAPTTNTSALHKRTGQGFSLRDLTKRKPMCWKKWRRKEKRANREASSPVDIQEPPCNTARKLQRMHTHVHTHNQHRVALADGNTLCDMQEYALMN